LKPGKGAVDRVRRSDERHTGIEQLPERAIRAARSKYDLLSFPGPKSGQANCDALGSAKLEIMHDDQDFHKQYNYKDRIS
jgi:hypothetical protein